MSGPWVVWLRRLPGLRAIANGFGAALRGRQTAPFEGSASYWRQRYAGGGDSGAGSYGKFAEFKARVLNSLFAEFGLSSVIEFGSGDGNQVRLLKVRDYLGVDISADAVARCRAAFADAPGRRFVLATDYSGERADAALSLDVIYHLVEDVAFEQYMRQLFAAAKRCVVIYSSDRDDEPDGRIARASSSLHRLGHPAPTSLDTGASRAQRVPVQRRLARWLVCRLLCLLVAHGAAVKVLLLSGANTIHTPRWANGLVAAGVSVVCASQHPFMPHVWDERVECVRLPHSPPWGYLVNGGVVARLFTQRRCDLLNAHYATGYGLLARRSGVRPCVLSIWGSDVYDFPALSPLHRSLVRSTLRWVDVVASTSRVMAQQAQRVLGSHELREPIAITPFGVDTTRFAPARSA